MILIRLSLSEVPHQQTQRFKGSHDLSSRQSCFRSPLLCLLLTFDLTIVPVHDHVNRLCKAFDLHSTPFVHDKAQSALLAKIDQSRGV